MCTKHVHMYSIVNENTEETIFDVCTHIPTSTKKSTVPRKQHSVVRWLARNTGWRYTDKQVEHSVDNTHINTCTHMDGVILK